ncbi:MAG: hypothetical protein ACT4N2_12425 [Hyphomicrobium sp.]
MASFEQPENPTAAVIANTADKAACRLLPAQYTEIINPPPGLTKRRPGRMK